MREPVHQSVLRFRASDQLASNTEAMARRQGMSVSEFIRHAIRRELDRNAA